MLTQFCVPFKIVERGQEKSAKIGVRISLELFYFFSIKKQMLPTDFKFNRFDTLYHLTLTLIYFISKAT